MSDRSSKEAIVKEIEENIDQSSGVIIVDYRGLNVAQLTELRSKYRDEEVVYKVYKNTLAKIAFENKGIEGVDELLKGPNGFAFGIKDPISVSKVSDEFAKDNEDLEIKGGIVDGKVISKDHVLALAKLPSEKELQGMLANVLNSPLTQLAGVLNNTISKVVYALNAVKEKKEQEEAA